MTSQQFNEFSRRSILAGARESGLRCPGCQAEIRFQEPVLICERCGTPHHDVCWNQKGCGAYECAPTRREASHLAPAAIHITPTELERAAPLVYSHSAAANAGGYGQQAAAGGKRRIGWVACLALLTGLAGIAFWGVLLGLLAAFLGTIALLVRRPRQRGIVVACLAILIGVGDFVGWVVIHGAALFGGGGPIAVALGDFEIDPSVWADQPVHIARALRSNALVESRGGVQELGLHRVGAGVVLRVADGAALVVTNRHVVDPDFTEGDAGDELSDVPFTIQLVDQPALPGNLVWVPPHGVDLALVEVPVHSPEVAQAMWDALAQTTIGSRVFAVGNPHGLGWSHAGGELSQIRRQSRGSLDVRILQTTAPMNPGNSGGGLYDEDGRLIGINTWTQDKRFAEGLGFSISLQTLLKLAPAQFQLPETQTLPPP